MNYPPLVTLFSPDARSLAVILGTNEIASAIAVELTREGYAVVLSCDPFPPVIRRGMAFHDALFDDHAAVEGVVGERAETALEIADVFVKPERVAVTPLALTDLIALRTPDLLIDARMQKHRVTPDLRGITRLSIGVGPNFISAPTAISRSKRIRPRRDCSSRAARRLLPMARRAGLGALERSALSIPTATANGARRWTLECAFLRGS